jgi:hypothetical protein
MEASVDGRKFCIGSSCSVAVGCADCVASNYLTIVNNEMDK